MPSRETVEAFVATVESGDFVGAIERFYAKDASMQENGAEPRQGRDRLMADEKRVMKANRKVTCVHVGPIHIEDDFVAIRWKFDFVAHDGRETGLEEVAWQTWRGEEVAFETFFYDPAQLE